MDKNGHIYVAPDAQIPLEDKARLEGYLRGRIEADELKSVAIKRLRQEMREMQDLDT